MNKITPFLMFEGRAGEALAFYTSVFPQSEIINVTYDEPQDPGAEKTIHHATFSLNGQQFMCIDSGLKHDFTFTPAISFYVNCDSENEIDEYFEKLSEAGQILMPLGSYGFSEKFAWVADKFGVSWQLNLPNKE